MLTSICPSGTRRRPWGRAPRPLSRTTRRPSPAPISAMPTGARRRSKTYRFTAAEFARIEQRVADPATGLIDRYHLCFALAKALEDNGDFAGAFRNYALGNELKRPECRYRAEVIETNTREQIRVCTAEFLAQRAGWGNPAPDPIFILGLPRSGSTLLEQILASHSQVEGTQELPDVQQIVTRLRGFDSDAADPRYPRILESLSAGDLQELGTQYLAGTRVYRGDRPFFIDKMPNNFRHLGLIHLMLPNARIIDARREPMACCFSNFKQLFANGQEFTYSIEDIARYYRTYLELMAHWQGVLPGQDLEGAVRGCGGGPGGERATSARLLRPRIRAGVYRIPRDPAQRADRKLRAGAPRPLPRRPRAVAQFRALAEPVGAGTRRRP